MVRKLLRNGFVSFASVLMFLPAAAAAAPTAAGTFEVDAPQVTGAEQRGRTCFVDLTATFMFEGTLEGDAPISFRIVQAGPCGETGVSQAFTAVGAFTGSVAAVPGGFSFRFQGHITDDGQARGQLVILDGTGGLTGLRGHLTLTGQAGVSGTYVGTVR